jgi:hypothetical protein
MARSAHNDVLDALLAEIATCTKIAVCSGAAAPSTHAEAMTTNMLANFTMTAGLGGVDYGAAATGSLGTSGGRKTEVVINSDLYIHNTGTATHIALCDANSVLFVTTATEQGLTEGGTVTVPAFIIEVEDPTVAP